MEYLVIALFSVALLVSMLWGFHLLYALVFGYVVFFTYGLYTGCTVRKLLQESWEHSKNIGSLLLIFCLIGILTGTWRASGTIAFLVVESSLILIPSLFLVSTFLLCALVSLLTGTAFGTSATMGVICMTMGNVLGVDSAYLGGAILSGSYFGDRMSPMSSSAHLVAKITQTNIFLNIKSMFYSCLLPTSLTCVLYVFLGRQNLGSTVPTDTLVLFQENFALSWLVATPALFMIILAFCKIHVRIIMLAGILSASVLCLYVQNMTFVELLQVYWGGFQSSNMILNSILGGGGLVSMLTVACIVAISSSYVGLFQASNLLGNIKEHIAHLAHKVSPYGSTMIIALFTCMMTCNQTLSIFLTKYLCDKQYYATEDLAHAIENTTVVMAGLVPWNIACSVVLANIHAPIMSIFYAFFLYLLPLLSIWTFSRKV